MSSAGLSCLLFPGSEGFFGEGDPNVDKNPQPWAKQTGQNFVDDNRHMDFAVTHAWPDNCESTGLTERLTNPAAHKSVLETSSSK